jgi:hypothetical protein
MKDSNGVKRENSINYVGCCGTFCKTCKPFIDGYCKGCKLGYDKKERDINKAKCKIKVCCLKEKKLETCADCSDFSSCNIIKSYHDKSGYKYKKYKQSIEFIIKYGYPKFIKIAEKWKGPYGKLE